MKLHGYELLLGTSWKVRNEAIKYSIGPTLTFSVFFSVATL